MATEDSTTKLGLTGWQMVEQLGVGAVFEVAVVRAPDGRDFICKRLAPHASAAHPSGSAALERERTLLQAARGAAVPEVVACGSDQGGGFLVETRAAGVALREFFPEGRPHLEAGAWVALARSAARALADLHERADRDGSLAVVHGDISPDNVFFAQPDTVTFIDFSSATWRDGPDPIFANDRGTVPYAAPELLRQEARSSPATDTYALAATLLAVAVGPPLVRATTEAGRLYEAATEGLMWRRIEERTDLPTAARSAIASALQYEAERRLASSRDFAGQLDVLSPPDPVRRE